MPLFRSFKAVSGKQSRARLAKEVLEKCLGLLEGAAAWATGCAWTDAVVAWTPLADYPTALGTLKVPER